MTPPTPLRQIAIASLAMVALSLTACGDDDDDAASTTTAAPSSTTSTTTGQLEQPAIWPAADVFFGTPRAAAADFVAQVLGVPPTLGEFQQGDTRSGEMELFSPGEGDGTRIVRSRLLLRQLGPDLGWFVLAAVHDQTTIAAPEARAVVTAGPTTVQGRGRGFEGNLIVSARIMGETEPIDEVSTQVGSMAEPEPFSVRLDLSEADPGDTVVLIARGDTGLETDPGELSAIPVTIAGR